MRLAPRISKTRKNAITNVMLFGFIFVVLISGLVLIGPGEEDRAPQGQAYRTESSAQEAWIHLHVITSIVFLLLVMLHLVFHTAYIKKLPRLLGLRTVGTREKKARGQ